MTVSYALYTSLMLGGLIAALLWHSTGSVILAAIAGIALGALTFYLVRMLEKFLSKKVISTTDAMREKHMAKKQAKQ